MCHLFLYLVRVVEHIKNSLNRLSHSVLAVHIILKESSAYTDELLKVTFHSGLARTFR